MEEYCKTPISSSSKLYLVKCGSLILPVLLLYCVLEAPINLNSATASQNDTLQSNQTIQDNTPSHVKDITLEVIPNRGEYTENQIIYLYARANGENDSGYRLILDEKDKSGKTIYKISTFTRTGKQVFALHPLDSGLYNITVTAIGNRASESASIIVSVVSLFWTSSVVFLYVALGFFAALLILILRTETQNSIQEILRFVFLSGIVASLLASLLLSDLEFGDNAPIGLVKAQDENNPLLEWTFNIGGVRDPLNGNRVGGLNIPVYVIAFGLIGGYLRYLYKTSRLLKDDDLKKEKEKMTKYLKDTSRADNLEIDRKIAFYEALEDLSLFFLAPILAVVVWFLFSQWEPLENSPSVLAVFSFTSGLVTNEIVSYITGFTKDNLKRRTEAEAESDTPSR